MLKTILAVVVIAVLALFAFVRLNPVDVEAYRADPETAPRPDVKGHVLVREGGDIEPAGFEMSQDDLAARLEEIILETPRTRHVAGDLTEDFATYVTRSRLWGFPDIANVKVVAVSETRAQVVILSRLYYGLDDLGVNRARVEGWLSQLPVE